MGTTLNPGSTVATPVLPATLSLLVPFDIGQTFIFKSVLKKPLDQWASVFPDDVEDAKNWSVDQDELGGFQKSMGWIATWRYFEGTAKPKLEGALTRLSAHIPGELETDRDGIRAIIFPNGIGVLIVRIKAAPLDDPKWSTMRDPGMKKQRRAACRAFLATAAACYLNFMYDAIRRRPAYENGFIERLQPVARKHGTVRAEYTYPLFFLDFADPADWFAGRPTPAVTRYDSARLYIDWRETTVHEASEDQRVRIERNFIVALAGWFALHVMNNRATHYILDAIHALAARRADPNATEGWAVRLAYMEAANQAFPIQWTSNTRDLCLLEAIHESWSSGRWWKNVERKTSLLAAHAEQLEADTNEHWNRRITGVGATIACFTLASAIADVMDIVGGSVALKLTLTLGVPAVLGIWLGHFVWTSLQRPARKPDLWSDFTIPHDAFAFAEEESTAGSRATGTAA